MKQAETERPEIAPPDVGAGENALESEADRTSAYRAALEGLYDNHVFPDGYEVSFDDYYDMSDNRFAVYDVDLDGREELILEYTTTMAAASGRIPYTNIIQRRIPMTRLEARMPGIRYSFRRAFQRTHSPTAMAFFISWIWIMIRLYFSILVSTY